MKKIGPGEKDFMKINFFFETNRLTLIVLFKNSIKVFNWLNGIHLVLDPNEKNWSVLI